MMHNSAVPTRHSEIIFSEFYNFVLSYFLEKSKLIPTETLIPITNQLKRGLSIDETQQNILNVFNISPMQQDEFLKKMQKNYLHINDNILKSALSHHFELCAPNTSHFEVLANIQKPSNDYSDYHKIIDWFTEDAIRAREKQLQEPGKATKRKNLSPIASDSLDNIFSTANAQKKPTITAIPKQDDTDVPPFTNHQQLIDHLIVAAENKDLCHIVVTRISVALMSDKIQEPYTILLNDSFFAEWREIYLGLNNHHEKEMIDLLLQALHQHIQSATRYVFFEQQHQVKNGQESQQVTTMPSAVKPEKTDSSAKKCSTPLFFSTDRTDLAVIEEIYKSQENHEFSNLSQHSSFAEINPILHSDLQPDKSSDTVPTTWISLSMLGGKTCERLNAELATNIPTNAPSLEQIPPNRRALLDRLNVAAKNPTRRPEVASEIKAAIFQDVLQEPYVLLTDRPTLKELRTIYLDAKSNKQLDCMALIQEKLEEYLKQEFYEQEEPSEEALSSQTLTY